MKRLAAVLILLAALVLPALADTFYTEHWNNLNNWTVTSGTPYISGGKLYGTSQLTYSGTLESPHYAIDSALSCPAPGGYYYHYLRRNWSQYYYVEAYYFTTNTMLVSVWLRDGDAYYELGETYTECGPLRSSITGSTITVSVNGGVRLVVEDGTLPTGGLGVGTSYVEQGGGMGETTLIYPTLPPAPTGLGGTPHAARVELTWQQTSGCYASIYRDGNYLAQILVYAPTGTYTDASVVVDHSYTYTVRQVCYETSPPSTPFSTRTLKPGYSVLETGSPTERSATWGGNPEVISLATGALTFRFPLGKLNQRAGPGFALRATWNSQFWSKDSATHMKAVDAGQGLGWNFSIGQIYPLYDDGVFVRFDFVDADGVIHQLFDRGGTNRYYKSEDSTYLLWDNLASPYPTLTFRDGTVWTFGCVAREDKPNEGTRYPTQLRDTNGNLVTITYRAALNLDPSITNSTGRISRIVDAAGTTNWTWQTINGDPHVTLVNFTGLNNQSYQVVSFSYNDPVTNQPSTITLTSPFGTDTHGTALLLRQAKFASAPSPFQFDYDTNTGELKKVTYPNKGYLRYDYKTATFLTSEGTEYTREIEKRYTSADGTAGAEQIYTFAHPDGDTSKPVHTQTTLLDAAGSKKTWDFDDGIASGHPWAAGLVTSQKTYQGTGGSPLRTVDTTWEQDAGYMTVNEFHNPRASDVATTVTTATGSLSSHVTSVVADETTGNVTEVRQYGYTGTLFRTTTSTYVTNLAYTNHAQYVNRHILNRPVEVRVCAGAAPCANNPVSLTTYAYDQYPNYPSWCSLPYVYIHYLPQYTPQHDDTNFSPSFIWRGNATSVTANGGNRCSTYNVAGNVTDSAGGQQPAVSMTYNSAGNMPAGSVPGSISSVSNTTSFGFNYDGTLAGTADSNGDTTSYTYSSFRPTSTTRNGSTITYAYADANPDWAYPFWRTDTTPAGVISKTIYDGFGREIRKGLRTATTPEPNGTWTFTETIYQPCSCGPMGRAVKTSRPYTTGNADGSRDTSSGTRYWRQTQYDALGRPTLVRTLQGESDSVVSGTTTTYGYDIETNSGATTTIADPVGKQKRYLYDLAGRLARVDEQDPNNPPNHPLKETARYEYDALGRLQYVKMGKAGETFRQTRWFEYNSLGQLVTATNPENGIVHYGYDSATGLLAAKTDAKSQTLYYVYDAYRRLTAIQAPQGTAKVTFGYDTDAMLSQTSYGRMMTAWSDSGYTWHFAYDQWGRVTTQTLETPSQELIDQQYTYDGDGRLQTAKRLLSTGVYDTLTYSYDAVTGRPSGLTGQTAAVDNVLYNLAGQMTRWREAGAYTASRTYSDARGWLSGMNVKDGSNQNLLDLGYTYLDDGRVQSVTDTVNPTLSAVYQYDPLSRLSHATAGQTETDPDHTGWKRIQSGTTSWDLQWTFDDFGNQLTQTKVSGSPGSPPEHTFSYEDANHPNKNRIITSGYEYDANGNLLLMPGISNMQWDVFDRLTSVTKSGTTSTYKYDAFGRRIEVNGTAHLYDKNGRLVSEGMAYGARVWIDYFAGQRLGHYRDRLGSVRARATTPPSYNSYYPYGEDSGATSTGQKFAELYRDPTGLDYAMNRYYASGVGRFLTADPGGASAADPTQPQSWNRYAYVLNSPVNANDPTGMIPCGLENSSPCPFLADDGDVSLFGQQALAEYAARVAAQWDANYGNSLISQFGINSPQVTSFAQSHSTSLSLALQVSSNASFSSPQEQVMAYLTAAGLSGLIDPSSIKASNEGIFFNWAGKDTAEKAQQILSSGSFDAGKFFGYFHSDQVGPIKGDFRSGDYGSRVLQIVAGENGVYADTDLFNPYNPVGFFLHGVGEVLPPRIVRILGIGP